MFTDKVQLHNTQTYSQKPLDTFAVSLLITFHILTRNYCGSLFVQTMCTQVFDVRLASEVIAAS